MIHLRSAAFSEEEIVDECVERAEAGQHVLYLRNTVAEAQESFRTLRHAVCAERAVVGCLHSRFPYFRREELEAFWLQRLGKHRQDDGTGLLLVATQVVEQSVDIDLDFIVSDLAPTDMLLQRMGRLWRHQRPNRRAGKAEFWIKIPTLDPFADAACLKAAFGKSGLVYAPYVLLRTAEVFRGREKIVLPDQIREVLEATYAPRGAEEEAPAWAELYADIERERVLFAAEAEAATRVLGQPSVADDRELLTRRKGPPTRDVVLVRSCEVVGADRWRVTCLDGESVEVSGWEWSFAAARAFHRNLARLPRYLAPSQAAPRWLASVMHRDVGWVVVAQDGLCSFPDSETNFILAYHADNGLEARQWNAPPESVSFEDDDEFDS